MLVLLEALAGDGFNLAPDLRIDAVSSNMLRLEVEVIEARQSEEVEHAVDDGIRIRGQVFRENNQHLIRAEQIEVSLDLRGVQAAPDQSRLSVRQALALNRQFALEVINVVLVVLFLLMTSTLLYRCLLICLRLT